MVNLVESKNYENFFKKFEIYKFFAQTIECSKKSSQIQRSLQISKKKFTKLLKFFKKFSKICKFKMKSSKNLSNIYKNLLNFYKVNSWVSEENLTTFLKKSFIK